MKTSMQARMGQSMSLTPQLLQSIRLLQVTSQQLEQEVQQLLERNPLVEQDIDEDAAEEDAADDCAAVECASWDELPEPMFASGGGTLGDDDAGARIAAGESTDPRVRLLALLQMRCDERELAIAAFWLDRCDDRGYLEGQAQALASGAVSVDGLPALPPKQELLETRQRLLLLGEWPGMSAENPQECLSSQLRCLPESQGRRLALRMVEDHIDLLARHDGVALASRLGAPPAEVATAVALVLSLQPSPVDQQPEPDPAFIVPDVVAWSAAGAWHVQLNERSAPKLRLCPYAEQAAAGHEAMRSLLDEARWMMRSIGMRNDTLLRTARALVNRQQAYLSRGEEAIVPLTLKEVADEIGVHESTVSRITTGKYIQTPRGTIELKRLFAVRLERTEVSGAAIKAMVRRLIASEPAHAPLADEVIAAMLARNGASIARRTVAKYREQLGIAPARQRRRERAASVRIEGSYALAG